jgi:ribosomal protein S18 acetylase RimI-like enzyme
MDKKTWQWQRKIDSRIFLVSTDRSLLSDSFVQEAFATEAMFWTKPLSSTAQATMLDNSITLGLYLLNKDKTQTIIGMARLITDYVTLAYLTDVYVLPSYQGDGLGKWLIGCSREICVEMQDLRFMVLMTGNEQAEKLYRRELGMSKVDGVEERLVCMGARRVKLAEAAAASSIQ